MRFQSSAGYVIVYRVDEELEELTVVAIFHGAQDRQPLPPMVNRALT